MPSRRGKCFMIRSMWSDFTSAYVAGSADMSRAMLYGAPNAFSPPDLETEVWKYKWFKLHKIVCQYVPAKTTDRYIPASDTTDYGTQYFDWMCILPVKTQTFYNSNSTWDTLINDFLIDESSGTYPQVRPLLRDRILRAAGKRLNPHVPHRFVFKPKTWMLNKTGPCYQVALGSESASDFNSWQRYNCHVGNLPLQKVHVQSDSSDTPAAITDVPSTPFCHVMTLFMHRPYTAGYQATFDPDNAFYFGFFRWCCYWKFFGTNLPYMERATA